MEKTYYLEDVTINARQNPRRFIIPTDEEISGLKIGEMVRLFFVLNFEAEDGCRAERMWVEISEINGDNFKGYLTNHPVYIKDLEIGELISFEKKNIATIILPHWPGAEKKAIITRKALDAKEINWLIRETPFNSDDSGWQLFYGDEDDVYLSDANNAVIVSLDNVIDFEPLLEHAFKSNHNAFEWNEEAGGFVEVEE